MSYKKWNRQDARKKGRGKFRCLKGKGENNAKAYHHIFHNSNMFGSRGCIGLVRHLCKLAIE